MVHKPSSLEMTPVDLPPEIVTALAPFAPLFSDRAWAKAQLLAVGALLVNGRRTVASALRIMGQAGERHFTNYHRVLNRDAWSCLAAGQVLLGLILAVLPKDAPLVLAADDTIERRNGRRIAAKGCYRDPVRSSVAHPIRCFGLKWVCLAVLVPVPWGGRPWALPLLTALSWPEGKGPRRGHKSSIDWARQLILQVRRWVPERELILVTDGGFAAVELASDCRRHRVTLVCRLRIDAALYDPPAVPPPGRRGPKPKKGPRQPQPEAAGGRPGHAMGVGRGGLVRRPTARRCRSSPAPGCGTPRTWTRCRSATSWPATPRASSGTRPTSAPTSDSRRSGSWAWWCNAGAWR